MKNILLIFTFSFLTLGLSGQTMAEKYKAKKQAKIEERAAKKAAESPYTDFKKVGKHLKNAGWSFFGAAISVPYAIAFNSTSIDNQTGMIEEGDALSTFFALGSVYAAAFTVANTGAQVIKAGWELRKGQKE